MGIFDFFRKPTIIKDELFGELRFVGFKDTSRNYYKGQVRFSPVNETINLIVEGNLPAPTAAQRAFYLNLQKTYFNYIDSIQAAVQEEFKEYSPGTEIRDFNKEFTVTGVTVPRTDQGALLWDISYRTIHNRLEFTAYFTDDALDTVIFDT